MTSTRSPRSPRSPRSAVVRGFARRTAPALPVSASLAVLVPLLLTAGCGGGGQGGGAPATPAPPTARQRQLTGLDLFVPRTRLRVGQEVGPVVAYGQYDDGTTGTVAAEWASSAPEVAAVSEDGATLTGTGPGDAELTASFEAVSASVALEVSEPVPRSTENRPDDFPGPQVHAVYALPSDGEDENLDRYGDIATSFEAIQNYLREQLGYRLRLDTFGGELDVTFLRMPFTNQEGDGVGGSLVHRLIEEADAALGYDPDRMYAIYYGGRVTALCGSAPLGGRGGAVYVHREGCSNSRPGRSPDEASTYEAVMVHELFHAFGAVPDCARNAGNGAHVVDDPTDVMFAGVDRGTRDQAVIDAGRDDYFGHGRADCLDLADTARVPWWEPAPGGAASRPGFRASIRIPPEDRPLRCGVAQH